MGQPPAMKIRVRPTNQASTIFQLEAGAEPVPGYQLVRFLGAGAFGQVWEVADTKGASLAMKFMPCQNSQAAAEEMACIRIVSTLKHPNLLRMDKVWSLPGFLVIGMELADGSLLDLHRFSMQERNQPLKSDLICDLFQQAADALDFLNTKHHQINGQLLALQHCDVKPSNFLLVGDVLKISDFGLTATSSESMRRHAKIGTPEFMAPEIRQGRLSNRTDQFSLAVSYCVMRSGKLPYPSRSRLSLFQELPKPDLTPFTTSEQVVLARALSPSPLSRWPSCLEFVNQLVRSLKKVSN